MVDRRKDSPFCDETAQRSAASALAAMVIEHNVKEGREVEIPSLGIKLTKDDLRESESIESRNKVNR